MPNSKHTYSIIFMNKIHSSICVYVAYATLFFKCITNTSRMFRSNFRTNYAKYYAEIIFEDKSIYYLYILLMQELKKSSYVGVICL